MPMSLIDTLEHASPALCSTAELVTADQLRAISHGHLDIITPVAAAFNKHAPEFDVVAPLRKAHFFGQASHESASFTTLEELASGSAYEGRRDLGNVNPGDGRRYKGRGIFQCTGRANYEHFGKLLGIDLINHPEHAADPEISVILALHYWNDRNISPYADRNDCLTVSVKINGRNRNTGLPNHFAERKQATARAIGVFHAA